MEELTFADNKITEIPPALFSKLNDSLKILIMADNKIKHLP